MVESAIYSMHCCSYNLGTVPTPLQSLQCSPCGSITVQKLDIAIRSLCQVARWQEGTWGASFDLLSWPAEFWGLKMRRAVIKIHRLCARVETG